jgi:hypothetical protein
LKKRDDRDLFTEFLKDSQAFSSCFEKYWKDASSNLFVFQIQPVHPMSPCSMIHAYLAENGKGNAQVVTTLLNMKTKLETECGLHVMGLAFDGDSCLNSLHHAFAEQWRRAVLQPTPGLFSHFPGSFAGTQDVFLFCGHARCDATAICSAPSLIYTPRADDLTALNPAFSV